MNTYQFNSYNFHDLINTAKELYDLYHNNFDHKWSKFDHEMMEEVYDLLEENERGIEEDLTLADSIICSR